MKLIYITLLTILISINSYSQSSEFELGIYNVGLGGIGSGIGAMINKKPNEKLITVFCKGFLKGALGGTFVYGSKKLVQNIYKENKIEYNWPAKILNSLGTSMIENASSNRTLLEQIHFNLGFNRFEFYTKDKFKVKYKIMPGALALTVFCAINNKPEWGLMLRSGEVIFSTNDDMNLNKNSNGRALVTSVIIRESKINDLSVIAHEFIHIYQYHDYNFVNPYFNDLVNKYDTNEGILKPRSSILYWDFNLIVLAGLYQIENINQLNYYDNFFEYEAEFYSADDVLFKSN